MLRALALALVLASLLAPPAKAQHLEKGLAAYQRGQYRSALAELLPLAQRGNPVAQGTVGVIYHKGLGVTADLEKAIDWYAKAADGGDTLAQRMLGDMHAEGVAGAPDYAAAAEWYEAAANGGDAEARRKLQALSRRTRGGSLESQTSPGWQEGTAKESRPKATGGRLSSRAGSLRAGAAHRKRAPGRPASCMSGMPDAPFDVELKVEFPRARLDHSRSIAELGKISGLGHRGRILGLMKPDLKLRSRPRAEGMSRGGTFCFWISGFEIVLRYAQIDVFVAREYPVGSCPYDAILAHEMEHVAVARQNLEEFAPRIRDALNSGSVPTAQTPVIVASAADATRNVEDISRENLGPVYTSMLRALRMAQGRVDSPQSYARVFAKCSNW